MKEQILVTGSSGFIGYHLCKRLCSMGYDVVGVDNHNDYYDISLKRNRLFDLSNYPNFTFIELDITDYDSLCYVFGGYKFSYVVNLAAQAGVRYSMIYPQTYVKNNVEGFLNILECSKHHKIKHLVYASSSSVYGANREIPFSVNQNVNHPISMYAATKKSNELMAHSYSSSFKLPTTGLRFFTVYGPYGRPDMAVFSFTKMIIENQPIDVYNDGNMMRDFTYVDDVVESVVRIIPHPYYGDNSWDATKPNPSTSFAPWKIYNIGNNNPVKLLDFIQTLEDKIGKKAIINFKPLQNGDVLDTYADINDLTKDFNFKPTTDLKTGISKFVDWYIEYYK